MSEYQDIISRLQTKVGPIILTEILELIENQEIAADALAPGDHMLLSGCNNAWVDAGTVNSG